MQIHSSQSLLCSGEVGEETFGVRNPFRAVSILASISLGFSSIILSSSLPVSLVTTNTGTGGLYSSDWNFSANVKLSSGLMRMTAIMAGILMDQKSERLSSSCSWWTRICWYVASNCVNGCQSIPRGDWSKFAHLKSKLEGWEPFLLASWI